MVYGTSFENWRAQVLRGSNPLPSARIWVRIYHFGSARIAQLVEHPLGKGKVKDSSSFPGSNEGICIYPKIIKKWKVLCG